MKNILNTLSWKTVEEPVKKRIPVAKNLKPSKVTLSDGSIWNTTATRVSKNRYNDGKDYFYFESTDVTRPTIGELYHDWSRDNDPLFGWMVSLNDVIDVEILPIKVKTASFPQNSLQPLFDADSNGAPYKGDWKSLEYTDLSLPDVDKEQKEIDTSNFNGRENLQLWTSKQSLSWKTVEPLPHVYIAGQYEVTEDDLSVDGSGQIAPKVIENCKKSFEKEVTELIQGTLFTLERISVTIPESYIEIKGELVGGPLEAVSDIEKKLQGSGLILSINDQPEKFSWKNVEMPEDIDLETIKKNIDAESVAWDGFHDVHHPILKVYLLDTNKVRRVFVGSDGMGNIEGEHLLCFVGAIRHIPNMGEVFDVYAVDNENLPAALEQGLSLDTLDSVAANPIKFASHTVFADPLTYTNGSDIDQSYEERNEVFHHTPATPTSPIVDSLFTEPDPKAFPNAKQQPNYLRSEEVSLAKPIDNLWHLRSSLHGDITSSKDYNSIREALATYLQQHSNAIFKVSSVDDSYVQLISKLSMDSSNSDMYFNSLDISSEDRVKESPVAQREQRDPVKYKLNNDDNKSYFEQGLHQTINRPENDRSITPYASLQFESVTA